MKYSFKMPSIFLLLLFIVTITFFTITYIFKNKPKVIPQYIQEDNENNSIVGLKKIVSTTVSYQGKTVSVSFTPCDSVDTILCFGSGAVSLGEAQNLLIWDIISTSNELHFGVMSRVQNKWPYIITIHFGEKEYNMTDYVFFKNKLPELFLQNIKVSQ